MTPDMRAAALLRNAATNALEDAVWQCLEAGLSEDEVQDAVAEAVADWEPS